jgi:hypothetical protein
MSGFHLIPFRFQTQRTAWQDLQYYRAQRASMMQDAQASLDAVNAAFHAAQQNLIGGITTIAQQRAIDRVQAELQAKLKSVQT